MTTPPWFDAIKSVFPRLHDPKSIITDLCRDNCIQTHKINQNRWFTMQTYPKIINWLQNERKTGRITIVSPSRSFGDGFSWKIRAKIDFLTFLTVRSIKMTIFTLRNDRIVKNQEWTPIFCSILVDNRSQSWKITWRVTILWGNRFGKRFDLTFWLKIASGNGKITKMNELFT